MILRLGLCFGVDIPKMSAIRFSFGPFSPRGKGVTLRGRISVDVDFEDVKFPRLIFYRKAHSFVKSVLKMA